MRSYYSRLVHFRISIIIEASKPAPLSFLRIRNNRGPKIPFPTHRLPPLYNITILHNPSRNFPSENRPLEAKLKAITRRRRLILRNEAIRGEFITRRE